MCAADSVVALPGRPTSWWGGLVRTVASVLGPPVQIAYAVPDAVAAAERWAATTGAGPFFVNEHIPLTDVTYRGEPSTFDHSSAYGQWGSVMVELVQDHGTAPSPVRELFAPDVGGLHHLAFIVDDVDAELDALVAAGHEVAMSATTGGGNMRFHFVDALATHGHFFELYPPTPGLRGFYAMVANAADGWDGTDPVRFL